MNSLFVRSLALSSILGGIVFGYQSYVDAQVVPSLAENVFPASAGSDPTPTPTPTPDNPPTDPCDSTSPGGLIDFENIPDPSAPDGTRTPQEGEEITDQYLASHGVTFEAVYDTPFDGRAFIGSYGLPKPSGTGWMCDECFSPNSLNKDSAKDQDTADLMKDWHLQITKRRTNGQNGHIGLMIYYSTPVSEASGQIMDIDNLEHWEVTAYDANDNVVASQHLSSPGGFGANTSNGLLETFRLSASSAVITRIHLDGWKNSNPRHGLAFDNFSPATICH